MVVTIASQPDDVPSPALAAALERLGILPPERVPLWAAHWIVAGHDGERLVFLAGLHGDDPHDVHDALPGALRDCGVPWPESDVAAAIVAFTHLARMHLAGQAAALWVAQKVEEIVLNSGYSAGVMSLPLGQTYGITDAWDAGWGGTNAQLAAAVTAACEEQLAATSPGRSSPGAGTLT
jgi:hypothetical protein